MLEKIKKEIEIDAIVKFKNGKSIYGVIIDLIKDEKVDDLRFVPNQWLKLYRDTEHPQFIMTLDSTSVSAVDICLK